MNRTSTLGKPDCEFLAYASSIGDRCTLYATDWNLDPGRLERRNRRSRDVTLPRRRNDKY